MDQSHKISAFLRWAGSKRKLLPRLTAAAPKTYDRYVEPFAGSACLFFELQPAKALLGDINKDLIETYKQVRQDPLGVWDELKDIKKGEAAYYRLRKADPMNLSPNRKAARFIFLNRYCFNGLYRTNRQGGFNVPYGGRRNGQLPSAEILQNCAFSLKKAKLNISSFEDTLALVRPGDFVYIDPPYCIKARRVFNDYSNASFGTEQLKRLRSYLLLLDKQNIPFLVSYGYSREALELAKGFRSTHTFVQRQIGGFVASRRRAREMMITNY